MLLRTESCLKRQKWSPYKVKGLFSTLICTRKQKNGPPSADQAHSIASYNSCHAPSANAVDSPPSPVPPFLLAQNLSSKWIAPTDNIRPNFNDVIGSYRIKPPVVTALCVFWHYSLTYSHKLFFGSVINACLPRWRRVGLVFFFIITKQ